MRKCQGLGSLIRSIIPTRIRTMRGMVAGEMSGCWFSFTVQASCFCYFFPIVKSKGKNRSKQLGDGFFTHASIGTAFIQLIEYILKERNNIVF